MPKRAIKPIESFVAFLREIDKISNVPSEDEGEANEFQKFDGDVEKIMSVSHETLKKREQAWRAHRRAGKRVTA